LDFALLAGFTLGGAWLTKSPAIFFALMLPTLWLFVKSPKSLFMVVPLTLLTLVIGYGFYNILRLGPTFHLIASRNADYVYPLSHFLTSPFDPLKPFLLQAWQWILIMGPFPIMVILVYNYMINYKKHWKELLVLTVWFLAPIFIESEFAKVLTARYILISIPFLIIIAGASLLETRRNWVRALVFVLAFFVAQSLVFDFHLLTDPTKANLPRSERSGYLEEWTAGQGIKETADYLRNEELKNPDTKIVVGTEGYFGTLPDGLQIYLNDRPEITVIGTGLDFTKLPESLSASKKAGNRTYLIVNNERFRGDSEKQGLRLISSYPKAEKPDGTRQSLLFFEVTKP
jgi:hypothetical protein